MNTFAAKLDMNHVYFLFYVEIILHYKTCTHGVYFRIALLKYRFYYNIVNHIATYFKHLINCFKINLKNNNLRLRLTLK